ncbi:methyltransferase domain-containing protein [Streptomyces werraensis]|uniref:methyltransferase domain-containing protein n=1 Tax=Streptomyces werraensis TaxID=68284 RepID=UPI0037F730D6
MDHDGHEQHSSPGRRSPRRALAVSVASSRHDGTPVDYAVGDISSLDAPDGHYDGVRCERVLQHLPDPDAAIRELIRVTRPGGRVCVLDTDWPSCAWDGFDP